MKCYIADAFTDTVFKGNPAAVCLPEQWIPDELMQNIARENNLSETAFTVTKGDAYELRWISFLTKSGELTVRKKDGRYELDMPPIPCTEYRSQRRWQRPWDLCRPKHGSYVIWSAAPVTAMSSLCGQKS